ncbi:hypothetical protein [Paenibacillus chungangensis]|uniref:Uncharacterized protein n=1 Tax=Paenibacillus chungangensis TaxID=696535 RepID=A0ABW3HL61_9BACL
MEKLLHKKTELYPKDTQTHIRYKFVLDQPASRLNFMVKYSPKEWNDEQLSKQVIEESLLKYNGTADASQEDTWKRFVPLKNLITFSIDDCNGFRGACHRQNPDQILMIDEDSASPGLIPGKLPTGHWEITLSIHALLTPSCHCELLVWKGETKYEKLASL